MKQIYYKTAICLQIEINTITQKTSNRDGIDEAVIQQSSEFGEARNTSNHVHPAFPGTAPPLWWAGPRGFPSEAAVLP